MSQPLGKVTIDLEVERGADAEVRIVVPHEWLTSGATVEVELPSLLVCAGCHGGGCDACGRSGAVRVERDPSAPPVRVALPRRDPSLGEFALRLPHQGASSSVAQRPRGHLLLVVESTEDATRAPSFGVQRIANFSQDGAARDQERQRLMVRSLIMATFLILTFVGLLRLSGWL